MNNSSKQEFPGSGKRILIVDDSEITIKLLTAQLEGKGFEIITADSAEMATKLILKKSTRPHLVLLDIKMPNIDGMQFCRLMKCNEMFQGIKVLFCSSMEEEELKKIADECGADGYVCKNDFLGKSILERVD